MALRKWSLSTMRILGRCCFFTAVILTACAGGADAAWNLNHSGSLKHGGGREMLGEETKSWSNFTRTVFRVGNSEEKAPWPELKLDTRSVLAIILGGTCSSFTTAAGLGGGGLFVPLFNLLLLFDSKTSAALSSCVMVGGQFMTMVLNLSQSHPVFPERSLIDFDAALLLQPNLLLGISVGVILNVVFPNWLLTLLLTVVLFYMTFYSCKSGMKLWKRESNQLSQVFSNQSALSNHGAMGEIVTETSVSLPKSSENLMESFLERGNSSRFPVNKIMALAIVWLAFGAVQFLREGKGGKSKCGVVYWVITASQIQLALIVTHYTVDSVRDSADNTKGDSASPDDAFVVEPQVRSDFPKISLMAGIIGGMLGIAGAVIINPMLISAGMHPQVTAATSGFMVVFSASLSVVQYWLMGRIPMDWALTSAGLSAFCAAVGIVVVRRIINKYGRSSLVVFLVAFVLLISALLMAILGGWNVWEQLHKGAYMGFHHPC